MPIREGSRVTLADGAGRGGRIAAPSHLMRGWIVHWDESNIRTHEPVRSLVAEQACLTRRPPERAIRQTAKARRA